MSNLIDGTQDNDTLTGTRGVDIVRALEGGDIVEALGGNDTLRGATGEDQLYGGNGADLIFGGAQNDFIFGGSGGDRIFGGMGADHITLGGGKDRASGGQGEDVFFGSAGHNRINGGAGDDTVIYASEISDYSFADGETALIVFRGSGSGEGPGSDRLWNVEKLEFTNYTAHLDGQTNNIILARDDAFSTTENAALALSFDQLTANDFDFDMTPLLITRATSATAGVSVNVVDGTVVYDQGSAFDYLAEGEITTDTFTYTVTDGQGSTARASVTVTIVGEIDYPLVISEIMYNPRSQEDDWEWVEVANVGLEAIDLAGWVIDDGDGNSHAAANIAGGTIKAGESAILYNGDDLSPGAFQAAWGVGINLIAVSGWSAMELGNGGDKVGLWSSFDSYSGNQASHASAVTSVSYDDEGDWPADNNTASIHLTDLTADPNDGTQWARSTTGQVTPHGTGTTATQAGGNSGQDIGSPGGIQDSDVTIMINEVDADTVGTDTAEFVELWDGGQGNTPLDGLVVVFYNGAGDASYIALDLDGHTTDADGFFMIGNAGVEGVDIRLAFNALQNGADAVALIEGDADDFPNDTPVSALDGTTLVDALVYGSNHADDLGLLEGLGQSVQVNEDANGQSESQSISRSSDGGDWIVQEATPSASNDLGAAAAGFAATLEQTRGAETGRFEVLANARAEAELDVLREAQDMALLEADVFLLA